MAHGPAYWLPTFVQPLGTVALGLAASFIALRQWVTASEKFRFDLFAKRYEVYVTVCDNIGKLADYGEFSVHEEYIKNLEKIDADIMLFYGSAISTPIRIATISARKLLSQSKIPFEDQMDFDNLKESSKNFNNINYIRTSVLPLMQAFIDFSHSGMPTELRLRWHFSSTIRFLSGLLRH